MSRLASSLSRRAVLSGLAALPAVSALPPAAAARADADLVLVALSDLHSCYGSLAAVVAAVKAVRAAAPDAAMGILINGDLFDRSDAVARISSGMVDWAALGALAAVAPVILNIGDQEVALRDDLASVVAGAKRLGVTVIGNVIDTRSGKFYALPAAHVPARGRRIGVLGLAPDDPDLWRAPARDALQVPAPLDFLDRAAPVAFEDADLKLVMSHAGLAVDKAMLPRLPEGALVIGGHDHLELAHEADGRHLVHPGAYGESASVISVRFYGARPSISVARAQVLPGADEDLSVAALTQTVRLRFLPEAARERIGTLKTALSRADCAMLAADAVRDAAGADLALVDHVAIGPAPAAGPLLRYDLDKLVRRDSAVAVAEATGAQLARALAHANQHAPGRDFASRSGDYVHAQTLRLDPAATYRIAATEWVAARAERYLGGHDLAFAPAPTGGTLKACVEESLRQRA